MTVKERMIIIRLKNKIKEYPQFAEEIGLVTDIKKQEGTTSYEEKALSVSQKKF